MNRNRYILILVISFLLLFTTRLPSQEKQNKKPPVMSCEHMFAVIDVSLVEAQGIDDSFIIIIFRPGRDESLKLTKWRIKEITKHFEFRRNSHLLVAAIGNESKDIPKAEIYIGGKLFDEVWFPENNCKKLCVG